MKFDTRPTCLVILGLVVALGGIARAEEPLTVFVAKHVVTMDPRYPEAKVVAVRDGRIVAVGRGVDDLAPWLSRYPHTIDRRFARRVLVPGFVDPHIHPLLAALFLPHHFATPDDWTFPSGRVRGVRSREAFMDRLREGASALDDPSEWLLAFGWAEAVHGAITRSDLDAIDAARPIALSSRSTHTMILNGRALEMLGLTPEIVAAHPVPGEADHETGRFIESANFLMVLPRISPVIFALDRLHRGLTTFRDMAHSAGITTLAEPGSGIVAGAGDVLKELAMMAPILDASDVPFRTYLFPAAFPNMHRLGDVDRVLDYIAQLTDHDTEGIRFLPKKVKFLFDGSYVDQLGLYDPPGYIDGHMGVHIDPPELFAELVPRFWREGYSIHVHVQGDAGARRTVETLAALQEEKPRFDHRFVLEHVGQISQESLEQAARLGASVSALIYPLHSMGDSFADGVLGHDRMEMAFPYAEMRRQGIRVALHSDTPVAPPNPLRNAWIALNRETTSSRVIGARQALSRHDALRAITIDAAFMLGLEGEIGSIRPGKRADFTVLDANPLETDPEDWGEIEVWGTVFGGRPRPAR